MLYYKGWLFETVGKPPSLATKIFMTIIKLVNKNASFFSFQDMMPWMLVPSIKDTLRRYLRSVRPLVDDEEYDEYVKLAGEFESTIAPSLQRKLWLKWLTSRNY
uniref:Choline/carnitine acyltransferase domain-containing protein n=1 Tax=Plectus sambesii TaxID=2011161 RepID=A0A914V2P1_9BILA